MRDERSHSVCSGSAAQFCNACATAWQYSKEMTSHMLSQKRTTGRIGKCRPSDRPYKRIEDAAAERTESVQERSRARARASSFEPDSDQRSRQVQAPDTRRAT